MSFEFIWAKIMLRILNLEAGYGALRVLKGISLHVSEGEAVTLIGANGAGKTSLILSLVGVLPADGAVTVDGLTLCPENLPALRRKIGVVFQDPDDQLFMPTVAEDVGFGPVNMGMSGREVDRAVERALAQVDMPGFEQRSPHHMSIGEKKRIAIATVLSMKPEILALDEPSSNLDPRHRRELITLLNSLRLTKVISTHDLDFVRETCSRVAVMQDGRIAAVGAAPEILDNASLLIEAGILL